MSGNQAARAVAARGWLLILVVCVSEALMMTGFSAYWSLLPVLQPAWSMNNALAGWLSGVFFGGYVVAVPFLAAITDRIDARLIVLLGAALAAAGLLGMALLADGFWTALPWRIVAGAGLAGTYMPGLKVLTDRLRSGNQARAVAFYTSCFSVGSALSYVVAGMALEWLGWRGAMLLAAAGPLLGILAYLVLLEPHRPQHDGTPRGHVLDFRPVFRAPEAMGYVLAYAGHTAELFAMRSWIVPFLVFSLGTGGALDLDATVLAMAISLVAVVSSFGGAELALRFGRRRLVTSAMLSSFAVSAVVGFSAALPFTVVVAVCLIYAVTIQADSAALTAGAVAAAPPGHRGATLAVHSTLGFSGALFAPMVVGVVLDEAAPLGGTTAWGLAFLSMGAMGLLGFFCFAALARYHAGRRD
ncbi:MAG: MFS transporter [Proteobacteria bacterium]|nr:MFS transporter [Pseudomonadota bacterium]